MTGRMQKQAWYTVLWWLLAAILLLAGCGRGADRATPTAVGAVTVVVTATGGPTDSAPPAGTATFTATPPPTETAAPTSTPRPDDTPANQPVAALSPSSGPPGTEVELMASGLPPGAALELGAGRADSEYDVVATATADASGALQTRVAIPDYAEPGETWVLVVDVVGTRTKAVSNVFDVTGGNRFTRTNIYLIAVGDAGASGREIGCGDSVVPVEIEIEPTIAPLSAALENLLALEDREHGQSGLYNALYQSDLAVEGIDIEGGEAIIELSGTLTLGGVCDAPRVAAQLERTALQYDTVDSVSVFVNGTPLEELLSAN